MSRTRLIAWAFIVPILLLHFVVKISPSVSAVYYSMTEWSCIGAAEFIGLENFRKLLFEDRAFWQAFWHNWLWLSFSVFTFAMALLAATLLGFISKASLTFRTLLFIPYILPSVVVAGIWRNLLNPDLGIGAQLAAIGIPGLDIAFLGIPETSLAAVFFIDNWRWWVFLMLLLLAALQNISIELYESARVDGASAWQEFWHISLPGIRPTLMFLILMVSIWTFMVFDFVWLLTRGGPAGSSEVLNTLVMKHAFLRFDAGYATAIGLLLSVISSVFIVMFLMRSYFLQIPDDFRDAARVEGAGELGIFWRIMVPLTWPAFLTVALVNSMNIWNEFLIATVFLTKTEKFTVVTSYQAFTVRFGRAWTLTSAASLMMIFPIVAMFLALQRRFVQGLTQGGLKS